MSKRKSFIFTNKKHSDKAIMSAILGVISLVSLGIVIFLSYQKQGVVPAGYGLTGVLAAVFSLTGLILGILTVREKDSYHFFPWLGILFNALALGLIGFLVYIGR